MKATILLAEDERDMREVLCDYFTAKSGGELTMISAPDGNTALHLIETQPFDLLLLDIMLPGTDGFALCRAVMNRARHPSCSSPRARTSRTSCTATVWVRTTTLSNRFRLLCCTPKHRLCCAVHAA